MYDSFQRRAQVCVAFISLGFLGCSLTPDPNANTPTAATEFAQPAGNGSSSKAEARPGGSEEKSAGSLAGSPKKPEKGQPPAAKPSATADDRQARKEKLLSALKLCGKSYYELSSHYLYEDRQDADTARDIVYDVMFRKSGDLVEGFPTGRKEGCCKGAEGKLPGARCAGREWTPKA
jgi:hypothetical protein